MPNPDTPVFSIRDVPNRTRIRLTGSDRAKFLHNFCTADVKKLGDGDVAEAFVTNVKARVLGHVWVTNEGDSLVVETWPGEGPPLLAHLDRYLITEDVTLADESADGPEDPAVEPRRVAAALPRYGVDFDDGYLAPEANRPDAISYVKGCYLGQEPIARIDALGHVNRLVVGLAIDGDPPAAGSSVLTDDVEVGRVTSAAVYDGATFAIATVKAKRAAAGERLAVGDATATVRGD